MKSLTGISIAFIALAGCTEYRTHSSYVAHVDNTNNLLYGADKTAASNGCYDTAETDEARRGCVDEAVDQLMSRKGYSFYKRSIGVVNDLEGEGKVALTEDGTEWYFTAEKSVDSAE